MRIVRLYFDFVSPYAWLALAQAEDFARTNGVTWDPRPVVYGKLLDASGLVGPAESPSKRRYTFIDIVRCARDLDLPVQGPPAHPFRSLEALRTVGLFSDHDKALMLAVALANAAWSEGRDLTDVATLTDVVAGQGLDAANLADRISSREAKVRLHETTADAIERGVFGVPTLELDGELFWGHDRLPHLAGRLAGSPRPVVEAVDRILARPRAADRKNRRKRLS